jgi:DmsE family decaheme c-type cytochrome
MRRFPLWMGALSTSCLLTCAVFVGQASMQSTSPLPPLAVTLAQTPPQDTAKPAGQAPAGQAQYVGEETCLTCHADMTKGYHTSAHGRKADERTPIANRGCETCHGPGGAHVESGGDKTKILNPATMKAADASETCTTCHNRTTHAGWSGSKHDARNMSCATCHSVHAPKSEHAQLNEASEFELCSQCHQRESMKIQRSSHMPLREGKMECSSCHNPHGSTTNVRMLRQGSSIAESCATCHADKRGPFLWEHAVGRENCATCHDPHGSNNDRMLVAKVPQLCQRCHVHSRHPATIYDQTQVNNRSNRIVGRGCLNCHSMVHGSNHPSSGKYFLR